MHFYALGAIMVSAKLNFYRPFMPIAVEYSDIVKSPDSHIPLMELHFKLCTTMGNLYYCKNIHLLRKGSELTCAAAIFYHLDSVVTSWFVLCWLSYYKM